jgi:hypothetical protein
MRAFRFLFAASIIALSAAAGMAQTVKTDFDRGYDFTQLRSFAFIEQPRKPNDALTANPFVDDRIKRDLESQLIANGFQKDTSGNPDFLIAYYATARERTRLQDNSQYGVLGRVRRLDVREESYIEGVLIVDFVDRSTNKLVWRGYATTTVDPKKSEKHILTAAERMINQFVKDGKPRNR